MSVRSKLSIEVKKDREELVERLADLITSGVKSKVCSKLEKGCEYPIDQIKAVNFSIPQAERYLTVVCENYPKACELNLGDQTI